MKMGSFKLLYNCVILYFESPKLHTYDLYHFSLDDVLLSGLVIFCKIQLQIFKRILSNHNKLSEFYLNLSDLFEFQPSLSSPHTMYNLKTKNYNFVLLKLRVHIELIQLF